MLIICMSFGFVFHTAPSDAVLLHFNPSFCFVFFYVKEIKNDLSTDRMDINTLFQVSV